MGCEITTLSEVAELTPGFAFKSRDFRKGARSKVIKIGDIQHETKEEDLTDVDADGYNDNQLSHYLVKKGDCLVAMTGNTIGKVGRMRSGVAYANQRVLKVTAKTDRLDSGYLWMLLLHPKFHNHVLSFIDSHSAQPNISAKSIGKYIFPLPDLQTQRRISAILVAIDSKIALNNRTNDYLAALGQTLFNEFDSDESNPFVTVSDIAEVNPRRTMKKGDEALCVEMANLSTSGPFPSDWCVKPYNGGAKFINGDTVMARITPCLENGKAGYVNFLNDGETAFGSTEYIVFTSKGDVPAEYLYFMVRNPEFVAYATARMSGSSGRQRVSASEIEQYEVRLPSEPQLALFKDVATFAMQGILKNSLENRQLTKLRDTLLPKLISGEIDVSKVEI